MPHIISIEIVCTFMLACGIQITPKKRFNSGQAKAVDQKGCESLIVAKSGFVCLSQARLGAAVFGRLQIAELTGNLFTEIPSELGACSSLKQLDLSRNLIGKIGLALCRQHQLVRLNLAHNRLHRIEGPELAGLSSLKTLILSNNEIEEITQQVGRLKNLRVLYLEANALTSLPSSIASLANLKELKLDWPLYLQPIHSQSITAASLMDKLADCAELLPQTLCLSIDQLFELLRRNLSPDSSTSISEFLCHFSSDVKIESTHSLVCRAIDSRHQGIAHHFILSDGQENLMTGKDLGEYFCASLRANCEWLADKLLVAECSIFPRTGKLGESALHQAAHMCSGRLVDRLLAKGLDPNLQDDEGNTPLHQLFATAINLISAASTHHRVSGSVSTSRNHQLTHIGKRPGGDSTHQHPKMRESREADRQVFYYDFTQRQDRRSLLHCFEELAEALIQAGADPNKYNRQGLTCWQLVLRDECYLLFRFLRESRLPAVKSIDWEYPLDFGEESVLHRALACRLQAFLFDLLSSSSRSDILFLDKRLQLPVEACAGKARLAHFKRLSFLTKKSLRQYFQFKPQREAEHRSPAASKRPVLSSQQLRTDRSEADEQEQASRTSAVRASHPRSFKADGMKRIEDSRSVSPSVETKPQSCEAKPVYLSIQKPSLRSLESRNTDRSSGGSTALNHRKVQLHRSARNAVNNGFDSNLCKTEETGAWIESVLSNMVNMKNEINMKKIVLQSANPSAVRTSLRNPVFSTNQAPSKVLRFTTQTSDQGVGDPTGANIPTIGDTSLDERVVVGCNQSIRAHRKTHKDLVSTEVNKKMFVDSICLLMKVKVSSLSREMSKQAVLLLEFDHRGIWIKNLSSEALSYALKQIVTISCSIKQIINQWANVLPAEHRTKLLTNIRSDPDVFKPLQLLRKWYTDYRHIQVGQLISSKEVARLLRLASLIDACSWLGSLDWSAAAQHTQSFQTRLFEEASKKQEENRTSVPQPQLYSHLDRKITVNFGRKILQKFSRHAPVGSFNQQPDGDSCRNARVETEACRSSGQSPRATLRLNSVRTDATLARPRLASSKTPICVHRFSLTAN